VTDEAFACNACPSTLCAALPVGNRPVGATSHKRQLVFNKQAITPAGPFLIDGCGTSTQRQWSGALAQRPRPWLISPSRSQRAGPPSRARCSEHSECAVCLSRGVVELRPGVPSFLGGPGSRGRDWGDHLYVVRVRREVVDMCVLPGGRCGRLPPTIDSPCCSPLSPLSWRSGVVTASPQRQRVLWAVRVRWHVPLLAMRKKSPACALAGVPGQVRRCGWCCFAYYSRAEFRNAGTDQQQADRSM